jgi:hypothetical protein
MGPSFSTSSGWWKRGFMTCFLPSTASASNSPILVFPFFLRGLREVCLAVMSSLCGAETKKIARNLDPKGNSRLQTYSSRKWHVTYISLWQNHISSRLSESASSLYAVFIMYKATK